MLADRGGGGCWGSEYVCKLATEARVLVGVILTFVALGEGMDRESVAAERARTAIHAV